MELIDTLQAAEPIEFDRRLPLMLDADEVIHLTGWNRKYLNALEEDGYVHCRQRGLYGKKWYRSAEILDLCGYKMKRK
jgi:hypothetical protein